MVKVVERIVFCVVSLLQFFDKIGEDFFRDAKRIHIFTFTKDVPNSCVFLFKRRKFKHVEIPFVNVCHCEICVENRLQR